MTTSLNYFYTEKVFISLVSIIYFVTKKKFLNNENEMKNFENFILKIFILFIIELWENFFNSYFKYRARTVDIFFI